MPPSVREAVDVAAARLAGSQSPRAEAEELVGRLLRLGRAQLTLQGHRRLEPEEDGRLGEWIARRLAGEPIQYITGRVAFRHLDLAIDRRALVPRPETEGLVEAVLQVLREQQERWPAPRVLDLGTGSGAIALSIASEWPESRLTATDFSEDALRLALANASALGLESRIRFLWGEWFDPVAGQLFEAVVSNPPYVSFDEADRLPSDVRDHEPAAALFAGPLGTEDLRLIVESAPPHLVPGGLLALELAEERAKEVADWLDGAREWERVRIIEDLAGRPRVLVARRPSGPAISPVRWPEES